MSFPSIQNFQISGSQLWNESMHVPVIHIKYNYFNTNVYSANKVNITIISAKWYIVVCRIASYLLEISYMYTLPLS